MSAAESKEVCRAFRNTGKCRFGDQCQRAHTQGEVIVPPPRAARYPIHPCSDGNACVRGRFCGGYHSEEDRTRVIPDVCRAFRRGNCLFGDKCPAEHMTVQPEEKRNLDCIRWVRDGDCKQITDNFCVYVHDPSKKGVGFPPGEEPQPRPRRNTRRTGGRGGAKKEGGAATGGAAPAQSSPAASNGGAEGAGKPRRRRTRGGAKKEGGAAAGGAAPAQTSPAASNGGAEGAAKARRRRPKKAGGAGGASGDAAPQATSPSEGASGASGERSSRRRRAPRDDQCFAFRDGGACAKGDECAFRHGGDDTRQLPDRPPRRKSDQICYNFKSGTPCSYGDNCRFVHDNAAPDPSTSTSN